MEIRDGRRILSVLLIIALSVIMLFVDMGQAEAKTDRGEVKRIKYISPSSITIEENTNGQWSLDEQGELYYRYNTSWNAEPEVFTVEYENGEEITYSSAGGRGDAFWSEHAYKSNDGETVTLYNCVRSNQNEKHFTVGSDNFFIFKFGEKQIKIPVTITPKKQQETDIEEIEYEPAVNEIGFSDDGCSIVYNGEKDIEQMYFFEHREHKEGDKLTVIEKNGDSKIYKYEPEKIISDGDNEELINARFVADDGSEISPDDVRFYDDQDLKEWGPGEECYFLVEYGGAVTKVPITVKENDVASISPYVKPDSEQQEIACDEELYDKYGNWNWLIDGITVHKTDGTTENIIYMQKNWIDDEEVENGGYYEKEGFFNENENEVYLDIRHQGMKDRGQWYVYYHGVECEIPTYHSNTAWKIKQKPTCSSTGIYEKICTCGEVIETDEIPIDKEAHKFTKYVYNNDAKVGVDGTETAVCDNGCGTTDTRTKPGTALEDSGSIGGGGSTGGGGFVPPASVQKPTIAADEHADFELSADGTKVTIKVKDGYELVDVKLNGESLGKVTVITSLKTGDKVTISTKKKLTDEEQAELERIERIKKGVQATTLKARSKAYKGKTRIYWTKSWGYKVDGYNVYKSTKKDGKYTFMGKTKKKYMYHTKKLKKGTRYYYYVQGYRTIGGEKVYTKKSLKAIRVAK